MTRFNVPVAFVAAACLAAVAMAQTNALDGPDAHSGRTLRVWGDIAMQSVVLSWEDHFHRDHPEVGFDNRLMGTDTAMPGLYNGNADIALLGRESNTAENDGFLHTRQYRPLKLRLMTGSLDAPGKTYAPVVFVHDRLPLDGLTVQQLGSILGCGETSGPPPKTWGDLGVTGPWKRQPIHVYTFDAESGTGLFLLQTLLSGSRKMNWPIIREFKNGSHRDGTPYPAGEQIMDALLRDPYALAISSLRYATPAVKAVKLARGQNSAFVLPTRDTVEDGSYPLSRMTYAFVDRPPGQPVAPLISEFLQFIYSPEGREIADQNGFLQLSPADAAAQVKLLK